MEIKERFIESEGHRLACLAVNEHLAGNEQPCIVFIHGVLASVNFWLDCVPPDVKKDRTWYSLSLPAHYPSTVPMDFTPEQVDDQWFFRVMNGALKALLGDRKAIIVGHSTGGFSALCLAINKAPNVMGVVSIGGFHSGHWGGVEGLLVKLAGLGTWAKSLFIANILLAKRSRFISRMFAALLAHKSAAFRSNPLSLRMLDNIQPHIYQLDTAALWTLFNGIRRLEIADQLHRINLPCYLFAGTHDPVIDAKQSLVLAGNIPQVKTIVFRNVGHMPFMEDTKAYFKALDKSLIDIARQYQRSPCHEMKEVNNDELSAI